MHMVEKILNNTTPYGKIRASHEGSLHSSTLIVLHIYINKTVHVYMLPSSYPQPPNLCEEAVIDRAMRTWILAHWIKPRNNQSAIFLPAFGRSIRVLHNADS